MRREQWLIRNEYIPKDPPGNHELFRKRFEMDFKPIEPKEGEAFLYRPTVKRKPRRLHGLKLILLFITIIWALRLIGRIISL